MVSVGGRMVSVGLYAYAERMRDRQKWGQKTLQKQRGKAVGSQGQLEKQIDVIIVK